MEEIACFVESAFLKIGFKNFVEEVFAKEGEKCKIKFCENLVCK